MRSQSILFRRIFLLLVAASPLLSGCSEGDGLPRQEITGTVTLDGQALETGTLQFQPDGTTLEGVAVAGGAVISGGRYRISRDQGLIPGTYKVMIFSHSSKQADDSADPGAMTRPPPELIPARYNTATTLTAEVRKDETNVFNYDLKK